MGEHLSILRGLMAFGLAAILVSCSASVHGNNPPTNTSNLVLKFSAGYLELSPDELSSMTITVDPQPGIPGNPMTRDFSGDKLKNLIVELGMNHPTQPGYPLAMRTGEVTLHFLSSDSATRKLLVLNNGWLEDETYQEVIYRTSQTIDQAWLQKQ